MKQTQTKQNKLFFFINNALISVLCISLEEMTLSDEELLQFLTKLATSNQT